MPFQKIINAQINRKFSLQFCTPTEDITTIETFLKYLNQEASCVIIPSYENSAIFDPENLLLSILPYTANMLVDVGIPYLETRGRKSGPIRHQSRYIIIDRKLVGIRIRPSENWPKSRTIKQNVSQSLKAYYEEHQISNYPNQVLIGNFLIATGQFKMAPLFASELTSMLDNNSWTLLLNDYYHMGCQIFSITNDMSEEKRKILKDPCQILKQYRKESTIIIYCGMHIATDTKQIYKTKSYAIQMDRMKRIDVKRLDQTYTDTFLIDLNKVKVSRKLHTSDDIKLTCLEIDVLDCRDLRIKRSFDRINFNELGRFEQSMEVEENDETKTQNELILYLWNLYVNIQHRLPFVLPCPMNNKDETLLKKLLKLAEISGTKISDLVLFIKLDSKTKFPKKYEDMNFKFVFLDRILNKEGDLFHIYFSIKERLLIHNIEKNEDFLHELDKRVIQCKGCIPEDSLKDGEITPELETLQDEDEKFVEKFVKKKTGLTLQNFYNQMIRYYPPSKVNEQFIEKLYQFLRRKTKNEFSGNSFQAFVLQNSFQAVKHIFVEAEKKYLASKSSGIKAEDDQNQQENQGQNNSFRDFIRKVRYHCAIQKKSNFPCHVCNTLFNRKEKNFYGRSCLKCSNFICYSCIDLKTGETAQSEDNIQICLVCLDKCDCEKCLRKRYKQQNILPTYDSQRSVGVRPSSNLFLQSSNENLPPYNHQAQIDEENALKRSGIKSEYAAPKLSQKMSNENSGIATSITIKPCWTCDISNRDGRVIKFQCTQCKDIKCLGCEKYENSNRNWVLRAGVLCNKCYQIQKQNQENKAQLKNLKSKVIGLEHEVALYKRQKLMASIYNPVNVFQNVIEEQGNDQDIEIPIDDHHTEKGGATPIFDRFGGSDANNSPYRFNTSNSRRSPSEHGSVASFGGGDKTKNNDESKSKRKNSSNSSGSISNSDRKGKVTQPVKLEKKRKNSSGSESMASFRGKKKSSRSNSSKSSKNSKGSKRQRSDSLKKKQTAGGRSSSVQSGQYNQSSSSKGSVRKGNGWKQNVHGQNDDRQDYDLTRGGFRGRGDRGGRGRGRGNNRFGQNNNRFGENQSRDGFERNGGWGGRGGEKGGNGRGRGGWKNNGDRDNWKSRERDDWGGNRDRENYERGDRDNWNNNGNNKRSNSRENDWGSGQSNKNLNDSWDRNNDNDQRSGQLIPTKPVSNNDLDY